MEAMEAALSAAAVNGADAKGLYLAPGHCRRHPILSEKAAKECEKNRCTDRPLQRAGTKQLGVNGLLR